MIMTEKLLICIDDTDNLESIGTGQLLELMCRELHQQGLGDAGFVSRHQLFIHEQIAYTSHNSSMCCEFITEDLPAVQAFAQSYLQERSAEGSDPGLCILSQQEGADYSLLTAFGRRAQTEVLQKADAYAVAAQVPELSLTEHGGTGDGVIGALAGVGLRLSGSDGRIKGKILPENGCEHLTAAEFCRRHDIAQVLTAEYTPLPAETELLFDAPTKAILVENRKTVLAEEHEGVWRPVPHRGRKK